MTGWIGFDVVVVEENGQKLPKPAGDNGNGKKTANRGRSVQ